MKYSRESIEKEFILLALPTIIEQILGTILQYVDTAMVGHLGAKATATVSLSSTYNWLIGSIISAIGIGFLSYIARAIGEENSDKIEHAAGQALTIAIVIGIILTFITELIAPYMPIWMGADVQIRTDGSNYFRIINSILIFRAIMIILGATLRATADTKTPMKINIVVNILNIVCNYILIYRLGLGTYGAGIGTAISFCFGGIMMLIAFLRNKKLNFQISKMKFEMNSLSNIMKISIPLVFTQIISCGGYVVAASFVSSMTTKIYAAHSIAITAEQLFYIPGYGMQAATSTMIGNAIGEKNRKKELNVISASIKIIVILMIISGSILFIYAKEMMSIFTNDEEVIEIGTRLLKIVAFTEPIFGAAAVIDGIYAGMGKTKYPMVVEIIGRWGIRILGSYIFVRRMNQGIETIWYCMISDNITRTILLVIGLIIILRTNSVKHNNKYI